MAMRAGSAGLGLTIEECEDTGQMIGALAQTAQGHGPLGVASRKRRSHSASDRPPTSLGTPGRRTSVYGSKTFDSPAKPEEWMMTTSSSSTSPSVWGSMFEHGSNSFRSTASVTRRISRGSLLGISRGRMSALGTPGTSRDASRSPMSPYGITSIGSRSGATPFLMSSTRTSLARSSPRQPMSP